MSGLIGRVKSDGLPQVVAETMINNFTEYDADDTYLQYRAIFSELHEQKLLFNPMGEDKFAMACELDELYILHFQAPSLGNDDFELTAFALIAQGLSLQQIQRAGFPVWEERETGVEFIQRVNELLK